MPASPWDPNDEIKVCLAGDAQVGKTSLLYRIVGESWSESYQPTMGTRVVDIRAAASKDAPALRVSLWDIMGESVFKQLLKESYFDDLDVLLAVFDVTKPDTLDHLEEWDHAAHSIASSFHTVLAGNKVDLLNAPVRNWREIEVYCARRTASFHAVSARTGAGVPEMFAAALRTATARRVAPAQG